MKKIKALNVEIRTLDTTITNMHPGFIIALRLAIETFVPGSSQLFDGNKKVRVSIHGIENSTRVRFQMRAPYYLTIIAITNIWL